MELACFPCVISGLFISIYIYIYIRQLRRLRLYDYIENRKIEKPFGYRLVTRLDIPNTRFIRDSCKKRYVEPSFSSNGT